MINLPFGIGNLGSDRCFLEVCCKLVCSQSTIIYSYPCPFHKLCQYMLELPSPCVSLTSSIYPVALQSPVSMLSLHSASVIILTSVSASGTDKSLLSCSLAGDCLTPWLSCLHQPCLSVRAQQFMVHQLGVKLK